MSELSTVNDFGERNLVEQMRELDVNEVVRQAMQNMREQFIVMQLSVEGVHAELTTSPTSGGGIRYWFRCPQCSRRVGKLYPNACRKCLGLDYKKHRYSKMIESQM